MAVLCSLSMAESPVLEELEIVYFPQVVYRGSPLSLKLSVPDALPVRITTNQVDFAELPAGERLREFTFRPVEPVQLGLSDGSRTWSFSLIQPDTTARLTARDGYLVADGVPAILLPQQRLPLPLDRRWETVELLERAVRSEKPGLGPILVLHQSERALVDWVKSSLTVDPVREESPDPESWFDLQGYLTGPAFPEADFILLVLRLEDLKRGVPEGQWLMGLQFLLQRVLDQTGAGQGILVSPDFDGPEDPWFRLLHAELSTLAAAHGLFYVDRSLEDEEWQARCTNILRRRFQLP